MPGAAERIAAKLAAKNAETNGHDEAEVEDTEEVEVVAQPTKPLSIKARAAAAKAAKQAKAAPVEADEPEDDGEGLPEVTDDDLEPAPPTKAKAKTAAKVAGKKPASPAQIAAREAFAARSKAKAAANAAAKAEPVAAKKPVQTTDEVKASQSARRAAERAAAAEAVKPKSPPTSRATKVKLTKAQLAAQAKAERAAVASKAKAPAAAKAKAAAKPKAEARPAGETKTKVLAMWAKGKTRKEIMEALDLSYASVFFHTKGVAGTGAGARGSIFIDSKLDENGAKFRSGKTEKVSRSEAMRRMYLSGVSVGDTARHFEVRYQIAYTAIRPLLTETEE